MRDLLLTGNIKSVTNSMLEKIEGKLKIVLCGDTSVKEFKDKRVVRYPFRENDREYRGIFKSYNFETAVYFSRVLDGQKRLYDEIENLENALYSAVLSGVHHFIYLTTNDYVDYADTTRTKLLKTCEDICKQFVDENDISVLILRLPYIFTMEETDCHLTKTIKRALEDRIICLDGSKEQITDFISDEDLGNLLARVYDEPLTGFRIANISGGNEMKLEKLAGFIQQVTGVEQVRYLDYREAVPIFINDGLMRQYYGWFATHLLENDMEDLVEVFKNNKKQIQKRRRRRIRNEKIRKALFVSGEMVFVFLMAELLTAWTANNYRMDYVDFRLLFVVIMGIIHGTGAGIVASILACVGYFAGDIFENNWQIIFFNIENWLPFAAYFLSGTIVGHVKDKNEENLRFLKEQSEILESKYAFLNDLYGKTLENKEEFSKQVIGYEDSFGKIYQVVRKLNSTMTDNIFYEAVFAIEESLSSTSVAIYTVGENSHFARLNVCSREINHQLAKSLNLEEYPMMSEQLFHNQNWYNAEGMSGYPAYAAPVWKDEQLHGAILIWRVKAAQMKMDYFNKFSILAGLVQDALIRAIEYGQQQAAAQMIENTKILKPEYFEEMILLKEKIGKEGMSDYTLLRITAENLSLQEIGDVVSENIRNTDSVGMRKDGFVYLLLSQTNEKSLQIVSDRLAPKGICLERI